MTDPRIGYAVDRFIRAFCAHIDAMQGAATHATVVRARERLPAILGRLLRDKKATHETARRCAAEYRLLVISEAETAFEDFEDYAAEAWIEIMDAAGDNG